MSSLGACCSPVDSSSSSVLVTSFSASGRSRRALASVVVILPCSNSWVARLARMIFWCAGLPPRRAPFVGVGMFSELLGHWARSAVSLRVAGGPRGVAPPCSILFGLAEVRVLVVQVVVATDGAQRVETGSAVLEGQTHLV